MAVVVRTHGGLGNQLFQLFFARLLSEALGTDYVEHHDVNYPHRFERSSAIPLATHPPTRLQLVISRLRLPKLLTRTGIARRERVRIGRDVYLDGYFQDVRDYHVFTHAAIQGQVNRLRRELAVEPRQAGAADQSGTLYHLRLGDFFAHRDEAVDHALARFAEIAPGSTIITNQEDVFQDPRIQRMMADKDCVLRPSSDLTPEDVLRLMASYPRIMTNNSTLALWASILGNAETSFDIPRLAELHEFLFGISSE